VNECKPLLRGLPRWARAAYSTDYETTEGLEGHDGESGEAGKSSTGPVSARRERGGNIADDTTTKGGEGNERNADGAGKSSTGPVFAPVAEKTLDASVREKILDAGQEKEEEKILDAGQEKEEEDDAEEAGAGKPKRRVFFDLIEMTAGAYTHPLLSST
jgi:hypothetical protein